LNGRRNNRVVPVIHAGRHRSPGKARKSRPDRMSLDAHDPDGHAVAVRVLPPAGCSKAAVKLVQRCRVLCQTTGRF
jgi:hypothetical protein